MSNDLKLLSKEQQVYLKIMDDLHSNWQPHAGQLDVGKKFYGKNLKNLFIQCGRKWGKSEFAIYALWRHALLNPGAACYYVAPEFAHGKEIVWRDARLYNMAPKEYIHGINNNECTIYLKNKAFIKVIGSENFAAANGLRPGFLVYDEFCEFHPRFHETMNPNRLVYKCPLVIIGTPPLQASRNKEQYIAMAQDCRDDKKESLWVQKTSYDNPINSVEELDKEKAKLFARGEEYLWYSQYEAKLTAGGKRVVFPMLTPDRHVKSHAAIMDEIKRDANKLEWYCVADPGTTTVMAVLFMAINPYTKKVYILDELYEKKAEKTSVRQIIPEIERKVEDLRSRQDFAEDWNKIYDEAAAWFSNEIMNQYGYYFRPTEKMRNKKENGISLIKDLLIYDVVVISERCKNLLWEMTNYIADDTGKLPKLNDHQIDCYTPGHEVYTSTGWKPIEQVTYNDKVAAVGPTGEFTFEIPSAIIEKSYDGEIHTYQSSGVDLCQVTSSHRVANIKQRKVKITKEYDISMDSAEDLDKYHTFYIPIAAVTKDNNKFKHDLPFSDNDLGFLIGNFIFHGFTHLNHGHYRTFFTFSEYNDCGRVERIKSILLKSNVPFSVEKCAAGSRVLVQTRDIYDFFKKIGNTHYRDLSAFIDKSYKDLHEGIIDGVTVDNTRGYISSYKKSYIDQLSIIAYLSGRGSYILTMPFERYYRLNIYNKSDVPVKHLERRNRVKSHYTGSVYCLSVSTGMLLVRKSGTPIISGNCLRYALGAANYSMVEVMEAVRHLGPRKLSDIQNAIQDRKLIDEDDWTNVFD